MTTCRHRPEALGNKASPREWCPQSCGASASHRRAGTRTPTQQRTIHTQQVERRSSEDRARVPTHRECRDERSSEATASGHAQRLERRRRATSLQPDSKHRGTSGFPRAESAPVMAMQLSDNSTERTQLRVLVRGRKLMPGERMCHRTSPPDT